MTFDEFMAKYTSFPVDVDSAFGDQCWDLVALYSQEVVGVPASESYGLPTGPTGSAREVYEYFQDPLPRYYDKLPTSATPRKGDIVVWGSGPGDDAGHIAIFIDGTLYSFTSFDQNWPAGSLPHVQQHNSTYVLGFLRPKAVQGDDMSKWTNGDTYNLLFHAVSPAVAQAAQAANYVGYFGAQDGQESESAFNTIISSPQFDFMVAAARAGSTVTEQQLLADIQAIVNKYKDGSVSS